MLLVRQPTTLASHAALDGYSVSLCGLLTFHPSNDNVGTFTDRKQVSCKRCKDLLDHVRDYIVEPAGEGEIYVTTEIVRRVMGKSTVHSEHTHYSLDGDKSVCGVVISNVPVKKIGRTHPDRPTCKKCLASPKVDLALRDAGAVKALSGRGTYDREAYGHTRRDT